MVRRFPPASNVIGQRQKNDEWRHSALTWIASHFVHCWFARRIFAKRHGKCQSCHSSSSTQRQVSSVLAVSLKWTVSAMKLPLEQVVYNCAASYCSVALHLCCSQCCHHPPGTELRAGRWPKLKLMLSCYQFISLCVMFSFMTKVSPKPSKVLLNNSLRVKTSGTWWITTTVAVSTVRQMGRRGCNLWWR